MDCLADLDTYWKAPFGFFSFSFPTESSNKPQTYRDFFLYVTYDRAVAILPGYIIFNTKAKVTHCSVYFSSKQLMRAAYLVSKSTYSANTFKPITKNTSCKLILKFCWLNSRVKWSAMMLLVGPVHAEFRLLSSLLKVIQILVGISPATWPVLCYKLGKGGISFHKLWWFIILQQFSCRAVTKHILNPMQFVNQTSGFYSICQNEQNKWVN